MCYIASTYLRMQVLQLRVACLVFGPVITFFDTICIIWTGYLISGLNDYLLLFRRVIAGEFDHQAVVDHRLYITLIEPAIEWVLRCIFKNANEVGTGKLQLQEETSQLLSSESADQ